MLRSFVSATALCSLLAASTVLAQPGGGGRGNRGGGFGGPGGGRMSSFMLLGVPEVQTELTLSDDQKKQVQTASDENRTQMRSNFQNMRDMSQEERTKAFADMAKKSDEAVAKILTADQVTRLKQLQLQAEGANALVTPDVVTKLKIKDDQKDKIQKIVDAARGQRGGRGNRGGGGNNGGGNNGGAAGGTSRSEQRAKTLKDALAVLDDDQLVSWGEMTGKEFKFPDNMGGGNRGGNRGGGRGNRGGGNGGNGGGGNGGNGGGNGN